MYDWPEVRAQTDAFWAAIRDNLADHGVDAPASLDRTTPNDQLWRSPELLISQTCGWPLVSRLAAHVAVVAIPTYNVEGCGEGTYRSALIARAPGDALDLARGRIAINNRDSLSGYWTLAHALAKGGLTAGDVGGWIETGSHRGSVKAVAEGRADIAAIDALSWRLALDHEPAARDVMVVGWTDELPALPFATSPGTDIEIIRAALDAAIAASPQAYLVEARGDSIEAYDSVIGLGLRARKAGY